MKQRNLARLAAFLVGMTGGAALGNDHGGGPLEPCVAHPWWCQPQCAMLNICRSGNTPIGTPDCLSEEHALRMCSISPEPFSPPFVPPVVGPPAPVCPAGQHYSGGECQADHECGNDEIGGGSEECEPCGAGQVPNEDGTACQSCPHGESGTPGVCTEPYYQVARCSRPLAALPAWVAQYLPFHVNVFVKEKRRYPGPLERGFFAVDMNDAVAAASMLFTSGLVVFTPGEIVQDADLGDCVYEPNVDSNRYDRVRSRMVNYRWTAYHLLVKEHGLHGYGTCITWADSVLAPGSHY